MSSLYGKNTLYGHTRDKNQNKSLAQQKKEMEAQLANHQKLSAAIQDLTGFKQVKAFRMALKMTTADEITNQAQNSALLECLSHTQLGTRLREDNDT